MKRAVAGFWWSPTAEGTPALAVTAAFFALGGLAGCFAALRTGAAGLEAVSSYLGRFLSAVQNGGREVPAWGELLWRTLRWPLGAALLGFSGLGLFGIPLLCGLRGFFLAFSTMTFGCACGQSGLLLAALLLGVPGVLTVPAFFLLSVQSLLTARVMAGRTGGQGKRELPFDRAYFYRCGVCAVAILTGLLVERYLVPALIRAFAASL